jgi:hypothetical protein
VSSSPFILPTAVGLRAAGYDNESRGFNEFGGVDSMNSYDSSSYDVQYHGSAWGMNSQSRLKRSAQSAITSVRITTASEA